ncbi:MAG: hypothetical protein LLG14_01320 [Nocardiaceae bacterium]|nr:hypothetical protein [Nocardiaceae bacterium]
MSPEHGLQRDVNSMPEATEDHHQTIEVTGDQVTTFAECIGVAVAAMPTLAGLGICLDDPSLRAELTDALRQEGIVNFRIVDRRHAIASYHKRVNKPAGFMSAATVLALGAAEHAYRKPVRRFSVVGRPTRIPGGPVAAAAVAIVCAGAVTIGYAQNGFNGASENAFGGPTFAFPTPPRGAKARPIHLNVRPVYSVSLESVDTAQQYYSYDRAPEIPDTPLEVMMPDGKVIQVDLPPILEPPRDLRAWLRQFLMPTKPEQQQVLPLPAPPPQQQQQAAPPPPPPPAP